MQKMAAIEKNNQNSFNVFPNEKTRLVYEKRIGIHYSHCSDFRQVGNQKINSKIVTTLVVYSKAGCKN